MVTALTLAAGVLSTMAAMTAAARWPMVGVIFYGANAVLAAATAAYCAATGHWLLALWLAVCAAANAWHAWQYWNRRKRKRAAALVGAKSRARIQALVRKVRETAKPRRGLRPAPGRAA